MLLSRVSYVQTTISVLTHSHSRVPLEISSATFILLKITWEWSEISQNIWRRFVVCLLINIFHSNISKKMLLLGKYFQNCQASFGRSECKWVNYHLIFSAVFLQNNWRWRPAPRTLQARCTAWAATPNSRRNSVAKTPWSPSSSNRVSARRHQTF